MSPQLRHTKPLSNHWADLTAFKIYQSQQLHLDSPEHSPAQTSAATVASGITPSGTVHIGNFREVVTAYFVTLALTKLGVTVRFIYSWDSFDTFRKVPANIKNHQQFQAYLGQPICDIPDPWNEAESYAQGRMIKFEQELSQCGIHPEFIYQHKMYRAGVYTQHIKTALDNTEKIKSILNEHRQTPLPDTWYPLVCYCAECSRDTTQIEAYHPPHELVVACSSCGHRAPYNLTTNQGIKLAWRIDWPMRWYHEKVDFEPGGKDHSSPGGSFETATQIATTVYSHLPPQYLGYDFVMVKYGTAKMSSSTGNIVSLGECLQVYEPAMIHFLFAAQRPNHDFSFGLDEDVLRIYEEYDAAIATVLAPPPTSRKHLKRYHQLTRIFELAHAHLGITDAADDKSRTILKQLKQLPSFRVLADQLQVMHCNIDATIQRFYPDFLPTALPQLHSRLHKVLYWLQHYADEKFVIKLNTKPSSRNWSPQQQQILHHMIRLLESYEFNNLNCELIHKLIYDQIIHPLAIDPQLAFTTIYQALINKDRGPKLANFLHEIGSKTALKCLKPPSPNSLDASSLL